MISMHSFTLGQTVDVPSSRPGMKGDTTNKINQPWYCSPVTGIALPVTTP